MQPYLDALNAMHDLLDALGEFQWRTWIEHDIREWESRKSAQHHLSAYGGMDSFNAVGFEDVWLGTLFEHLRIACQLFAQHATDATNVPSLEQALTRIGVELSGWRCLACGYGVVSRRDIDYFIARRVLRVRVLAEAQRIRLREFVASAIRSRPHDAVFTSERVAEWLDHSALNVRDSRDWLRPCPNCGSDDTAVYRWTLVVDRGHRFVPSGDNLPLKID